MPSNACDRETSLRLHAGGVVGCAGDHRQPDGNVATGRASRPGSRSPHAVCQQYQAIGSRHAWPRVGMELVSDGRLEQTVAWASGPRLWRQPAGRLGLQCLAVHGTASLARPWLQHQRNGRRRRQRKAARHAAKPHALSQPPASEPLPALDGYRIHVDRRSRQEPCQE